MFLYKATVAVMYADYTWAETSFTYTEDGRWDYPLEKLNAGTWKEAVRKNNLEAAVIAYAEKALGTKPIEFTLIRRYELAEG